MYAGAYVYGRRPTDVRRKHPGRPGTGRLVAQPEQCQVLLKERVPAYISWEQFERNLRQLEANTNVPLGVIRHGPSLLSGLVRCGRCGTRMAAAYQNNGSELRYRCQHRAINYGEARCQSLVGAWLARQGLGSPRARRAAKVARKAHEWTLAELAQALEMPEPTLYAWLRKGHVRARQAGRSSPPVWLIWADAGELTRLRRLRHASRPRPGPAPIGEAGEHGAETMRPDQALWRSRGERDAAVAIRSPTK
jgi:hypothetical protein